MMGFLQKFMTKYPAKPAVTQPADPGTFIKSDRLIPDHFAELAASPREKAVHVINVNNNTALTYFFTPSIGGKAAGIAQDFATKGICSIIDGRGQLYDYQVITDRQMSDIWYLIHAYERYRHFATAALYHEVYEYRSEERLSWDHFIDLALKFERELADKFNVIADYHTYKTRPTGFIEFEVEDEKAKI